MLDPILRLDHLRVGILHVLGRAAWYMSLTRMLFPGSWDDVENFRLKRQELYETIVRQYRRILEFEMNCVCASASGWNPAAKNVVSWHGLADMVAVIQDSDAALFEIVQAASSKQNLEQHYKDLELPSPSADSGLAIDEGIAPNNASPTAA